MAAVVVVFGLASAAAALWAAGPLLAGIDRATAGLAPARHGNVASAHDELSRGARSFAAGRERIDALWTRPALAIPILGEQMRALRRLRRRGTELAQAGAAAARAGEAPELRPHGGRVDISRMRELAGALERSATAMQAAARTVVAVRSPWLLRPIDDRRRLEAELARAYGPATSAAESTRLAPALLGADGPRRYFLAFTNSAEIRGAQSFIDEYGVLTAACSRCVAACAWSPRQTLPSLTAAMASAAAMPAWAALLAAAAWLPTLRASRADRRNSPARSW